MLNRPAFEMRGFYIGISRLCVPGSIFWIVFSVIAFWVRFCVSVLYEIASCVRFYVSVEYEIASCVRFVSPGFGGNTE